jgi:hypothetical protein
MMSRALPFTAAALARAIKGVELAGRYVVGVRVSDGTGIVADKPIDPASLVPDLEQPSPPAPRRFGEYFNGGQGET